MRVLRARGLPGSGCVGLQGGRHLRALSRGGEHILNFDPRMHQALSRIFPQIVGLLATELCALLGGVGCILLIFDKRSLPQYKNFGKRWRVQTLAKMGFCDTYVPCQEGSAIDF